LASFKENRVFQAFEHAAYNIRNEGKEGKVLPPDLFEALKNFAGDKEFPWYTLTANGVRFHQFVGALQIGKWCVEVLPKIDRYQTSGPLAQRVLIDMLRQAGFISVKTPTESNLRLKHNFILETYVQMFLAETWQIIHKGLVKFYHKEEGNNNSLKGSLVFSKHINKNNVHKERFFVRFSTYDREHPLNRVLYKTLLLISTLSINQEASTSSIAQLALFPELKDIPVSDEFFRKIKYNRKTEDYRKAIDIARLLLMNYHPDLSHGRNNVLALMFDMNDVWETWITRRLAVTSRKYGGIVDIRSQLKKTFWMGSTGERIRQKPDIIVEVDQNREFVLDTKWKIIDGSPSVDDLRQMFTYNKLFNVNKAFLVYPGEFHSINGEFYNNEENGVCGLKFIPFLKDGRLCRDAIDDFLNDLLKDKFHLMAIDT
jgi:5-methylcytosine-specific restriction enzyme subunit McrC